MKQLLPLTFTLGILLIFSCSKEDKAAVVLCDNDHAEFYYNGTLFNTALNPVGSEFMTPSGASCGIAAVLDESANNFTIHILGENHHINIRSEIGTLNSQTDFRYIRYTNSDMSSAFENLTTANENYIIIEELDRENNTVKGSFSFTIENDEGDVAEISEGEFSCTYHEI